MSFSFRGYYCRKYNLDYYARKRWLQQTVANAQNVRADLDQKYREFAAAKQQQDEQEAADEFEHMTENLHHLLSTKTNPSVFQSPFGPEFQATAFDIPIEQHIKDSFKVWTDDRPHPPRRGGVLGHVVDSCRCSFQNHLIKTQPNLPTFVTTATRFTENPNPYTMQAKLHATYQAGQPKHALKAHSFASTPLPLSSSANKQVHGTYQAPAGVGENWTSAQPPALKTKKGVDAVGKGLIYRHPRQNVSGPTQAPSTHWPPPCPTNDPQA